MWIVLFAIVALVIAWSFIVEARRPAIDKRMQKTAPGEIIETSLGYTHVRWMGPTRGPVIVAVHGLTTPSPVWNALATRLGELGYRTLVYDLYGRGFSSAPRGEQNCAFFIRQLDEVLASQGLDKDVTLMGFSMGGSIVTAYAAAYPEKMRRVILLASGGLDQNISGFTKFCLSTPWIGDWLFMALGKRRGLAGLKSKKSLAVEIDGLNEAQAAEYERRGFLPAVLSSRRGMLADELDAEHRLIARSDVPLLAIWGTEDTVIPISSMGRLAVANRLARQEQIEGAGHAMPYTHSTQIKSILAEVLVE